MRLHPRHRLVRDAENDLRKRILEWFDGVGSGLTTAEEVSVILTVMTSLTVGAMRYAVVAEREENARDGD